MVDKVERLFVLSVRHRFGTIVFLNRTPEGARGTLAQYCTDCWDELFDESDPMPQDPEELIRKYFRTYQSSEFVRRGVDEHYTIEENVEVGP